MIPVTLHLVEKQVTRLFRLWDVRRGGESKRAVFFDLDGTINRHDCLELLMQEVARRGLLSEDKIKMYQHANQSWKHRDWSFEKYLKFLIKLIEDLKFLSLPRLKKIARDAIQNQGSYYYLFPWLLLLRLKLLGYKLIALSGAPFFMAELYLDKIGLFPWKIHASNYIFKNNVFTGDLDLTVLKDKGAFIEQEYGQKFDLHQSIALGDTLLDSSMFERVGKKVAINPTYGMALKAKKERWPIVVERKDLVLFFHTGIMKPALPQ